MSSFQGFLKQSTAKNVTILMIDSSDHITGKTGLTLTTYLSKDCNTPATITPTVTELDAMNMKGVYKLALTAAHTDTLGEFKLMVSATGADPVDYKWQVCSYLPGEAATLQSDQAVNVTKIAGATVDANTAQLGVNVVNWKGSAAQNMTGDAYARLGAPAGASLSADIAAVNAKTTNLPASPAAVGSAMTLQASAVQAVWDALTSAFTTSGSIGKRLSDNVDAQISTRSTFAGGAVSSVTGNVGGSVNSVNSPVTVGTNNDKLNYGLSSAAVQAVWDALASALTTAGSIGKRIADYLTGDAYARLGAPSGASVAADIAAVKTQTDKMTFDASNRIASNTKAVNDATLAGAGTSGSPWGPA